MSKMRGTGEQSQFWGTGKIGNKYFDFGEQGNKSIYFRGTRQQVPPGRAPFIYLCIGETKRDH